MIGLQFRAVKAHHTVIGGKPDESFLVLINIVGLVTGHAPFNTEIFNLKGLRSTGQGKEQRNNDKETVIHFNEQENSCGVKTLAS